MEKILNTELTRHVEIHRAHRVEQIKSQLGIGQIVKKHYERSIDKAVSGQAGVYICITDTGITLVKDETETKIITMYVTTYGELVKCFNGAKNIPTSLRKKVDRNQSKFISHGKTIWH